MTPKELYKLTQSVARYDRRKQRLKLDIERYDSVKSLKQRRLYAEGVRKDATSNELLEETMPKVVWMDFITRFMNTTYEKVGGVPEHKCV